MKQSPDLLTAQQKQKKKRVDEIAKEREEKLEQMCSSVVDSALADATMELPTLDDITRELVLLEGNTDAKASSSVLVGYLNELEKIQKKGFPSLPDHVNTCVRLLKAIHPEKAKDVCSVIQTVLQFKC